jgi:2,4-dienoyl-CoA reductase-like NADH-dependent reductase (Old Yellow Enzyme family)
MMSARRANHDGNAAVFPDDDPRRHVEEQILRDGQADLIAVAREILNNPNWPMDAALKLGADGPFGNVPPQFGYWRGTRAKRGFGTRPSTWQNGLHEGS